MKTTLLLLVAMLCAACGAGPVSLGGRVVDESGSALHKVEVSTEPETDVVVTNSKGFFLLRQRIDDSGNTQPLKPGDYTVVARKMGYEDFTLKVSVADGPTRVNDLRLKARTLETGDTAPEALEEHKVSGGEGSTPIIGS